MFQEKNFFVYMMTNKNNTVIYVGFSGQVYERVQQHKKKYSKGFANKYNLNKLVYYEKFEYPNEAIKRENKLKSGIVNGKLT